MTSAILALTLATLAVSLFGRNDERQVAKSLKTTYSVPVEIEYLIALPKGYEDDPERRWPLLLFLHGAGESGRDLE